MKAAALNAGVFLGTIDYFLVLPGLPLEDFDGACDGQVTLLRQDQVQADAEDLVTRREDT
jgi:hypothetical protein